MRICPSTFHFINYKLPLPLAGASIIYMVVTVTTLTKKHYSDTLTILKLPATAAESVLLQKPLLWGPILGQTGMVERKHLSEP